MSEIPFLILPLRAQYTIAFNGNTQCLKVSPRQCSLNIFSVSCDIFQRHHRGDERKPSSSATIHYFSDNAPTLILVPSAF